MQQLPVAPLCGSLCDTSCCQMSCWRRGQPGCALQIAIEGSKGSPTADSYVLTLQVRERPAQSTDVMVEWPAEWKQGPGKLRFPWLGAAIPGMEVSNAAVSLGYPFVHHQGHTYDSIVGPQLWPAISHNNVTGQCCCLLSGPEEAHQMPGSVAWKLVRLLCLGHTASSSSPARSAWDAPAAEQQCGVVPVPRNS